MAFKVINRSTGEVIRHGIASMEVALRIADREEDASAFDRGHEFGVVA